MTGAPDAGAPPHDRLETVVVFDATAMIHRAYHGGGRRLDAHGVEVGAVDVFARRVARWIAGARSSRFVVVWDGDGPSFRNRIDPAYKAHRKAAPEALPPQLDRAREISAALGVAQARADGFEADDLMATIAARAREEGLATWLVTPDKDLFQAVTDAPPPVRVFDPVTKRVVDEAGVVARLGVPARAVIDFIALSGDSSDGIPGVAGVGPKAATALLDAFGDLDAVYARLDEVASLPIRGARAVSGRLAEGREAAFRSRALATASRDAPLGFDRSVADAALWRGPAADAEAVFGRLGVAAPLTILRRARGAA